MTPMHKIDKFCKECTTKCDIAIATFLDGLAELKERRTRWVDDERIKRPRQPARIMSDIIRVFIIVLPPIRMSEHSELDEHVGLFKFKNRCAEYSSEEREFGQCIDTKNNGA